MKILYISNKVPWPLDDGGAICTFDGIKTTHQLGHEVSLWSLNPIKHQTPIEEAEKALKFLNHFRYFSMNTSIKISDAVKNIFQKSSYNIDRFFQNEMDESLATFLKKKSFDIIQLEGIFVSPYIPTIRKYHNGILSLRSHNVEHEIWGRLAQQTKNPLKKKYVSFLAKRLKKAEWKALSSVDVVVPITENDAACFRNELPNLKMHVTPAGIDLERWIFKPTNKILNWYHIGAMDWMPNLDAVKWFLDEIHPNILKNLDGYQFHLAGKNLPKDLKNVNQQGILAYEEVLDSVQFCLDKDVCVVPLRVGSGIRIKILEAMSAGKLVISSSIGIQGINVKENEHFLLANSISDFLSLIEKFRINQINVETIVKNARLYIEENYSTEAVCQSLLHFYQKTIQETGKTVENNIE